MARTGGRHPIGRGAQDRRHLSRFHRSAGSTHRQHEFVAERPSDTEISFVNGVCFDTEALYDREVLFELEVSIAIMGTRIRQRSP